MSFREKSSWALLVAMGIVYGWYFATTLSHVLDTGVPQEADTARLFGTVVVMVVLTIAAHIAIAIISPKEADAADERDRLIGLRGDQRSGYVMGVGLFSTLGLALAGASLFWIAHAALAGLVLSELVKAVTKLIDYRRGVQS